MIGRVERRERKEMERELGKVKGIAMDGEWGEGKRYKLKEEWGGGKG